jgi:SLT domain-containing protein
MMQDPLYDKAIELLTRGHRLYGAGHLHAGIGEVPEQLRKHADRLTEAGLRASAAADSELAAGVQAASSDHAAGRYGTRRILDDARGDSMPAADTPLGRQEALVRMAARLRQQRHHIHRSHRHAHLLARRLRGLLYEKAVAPGRVGHWIAAALDHLGIVDPVARRNWIRGYQTLIARESGGRPAVVGLGSAQGVAQTIPATFARYHQRGTSTNIYDPVANICASMNYVIDRYGVSRSGKNLAAMVQQADAHRPPKGY